MCVKNNYIYDLIILITLVILFIPCSMRGQDSLFTIPPLKATETHFPLYNLYVFGGSSYMKQEKLWTANNTSRKLPMWYAHFGIGGDITITGTCKSGLGTNIGYKYSHYAYSDETKLSNRIDAHWLTHDFYIKYWLFQFGVQSNFFINSKIHNNDFFSYEGIYPDCFNPVALCVYGGIQINVNTIKLKINTGYYAISYLNYERISYYNFCNTYRPANWFYEFQITYDIYTTKKRNI